MYATEQITIGFAATITTVSTGLNNYLLNHHN